MSMPTSKKFKNIELFKYRTEQHDASKAIAHKRIIAYHALEKKQPRLWSYKSTDIYSAPDDLTLQSWYELAATARLNFDESIGRLTRCAPTSIPESFDRLLQKFEQAANAYREYRLESSHAADISPDSARNFLYLIPVLAHYSPSISIDSRNGLVNIDVRSHRFGVLSSQVAEDGKVFYSFAGKHDRLFKITGTAKFRTAKDFSQFQRVLNLL